MSRVYFPSRTRAIAPWDLRNTGDGYRRRGTIKGRSDLSRLSFPCPVYRSQHTNLCQQGFGSCQFANTFITESVRSCEGLKAVDNHHILRRRKPQWERVTLPCQKITASNSCKKPVQHKQNIVHSQRYFGGMSNIREDAAFWFRSLGCSTGRPQVNRTLNTLIKK